MKKFFVNYFKQIALVFGGAWNSCRIQHQERHGASRVHSCCSGRGPPARPGHAERGDFRAIGRVISPWGRRIGDLRFETEGQWKRSGTTVESLAKELRLALQYPEGAAM